ncbi:efflux RND transporter periplasmic adaptor subunit [Sediminibacterium sp.]|uniref:efflux RND transporter periplasmic adaptor subunit n=1 Tax=Sediminibacterium sp. TaxID=1917865 RepID=UPI0025DC9B15|nr:efflux RND transporter periplasmic adaptor subunit [Sediminibacterium sp.]
MKTYFKSPLFAVTVLLAVLMISSCHDSEVKSIEKESFVMSNKMLSSTKTAKALFTNTRNQLNFYGKITADNNKLIEVFPIVGGNVTKVNVGLGDYVEKGQLLATIRSTEVASIEKDLLDAKNDLLVAQNRLKVTKELYEGKLNTEREVIEAKSEVDKATAQLNRMKETYQIYNLKTGAIYEVRAPIAGFIIQKNINEGMLLRSDKTDNIFDIAQIDEVWAMANINESDISQVKLGVDAEITTLSYPDKKFYGKVDKIYNIIDPETKAMKARVKLKNDGFLLKPEMGATIQLSYTEDQKMIAIPSAAIVFAKSKNYVLVFHSKTNIEVREVSIYRQIGDTTYIAAGIKEGETVMTTNQLMVFEALND